MLNTSYLLTGLNALSRAYKTDYFLDGHRAASIIAAYFLFQEVPLPDDAVIIVQSMLDTQWMNTPLCAPLPDEPADPALIHQIVRTLEQNIDGLRQVGHNVIFPALALKAFRQLPSAVTPSRVDGICRLIESFTIIDAGNSEDDEIIPNFDKPSIAAEFILTELLSTIDAFSGRGQGWSGHLLTYGRALLDLRELGYGALASKGGSAFKSYIKRIRRGPLDTDKLRPEHPVSALRPHERAYWEERQTKSLALGHVFKYPYAFYGLMALTDNALLKAQCTKAAYHIF